MKRKLTMFLSLFFLGIGMLMAQTQVRGTVVGESGDPVIGATIQIKGTSQGTVSDMDGNFTLSAPAGGTLVISYVGYQTQEVPVRANVRVVLSEDTEMLEELVVTALGISRERKALGYAVQDVKDIANAGNPNLSTALQGKVSGVDIKVSSGMPGASTQFNIRGARSFTGNNQPLYVVDGLPISSNSPYSTLNSVTGADYSNRSIDIDPNDIESVNVLKGQAAAALYGIRASNGVVIITTKSGAGGEKGKTIVTFAQNTSFDKVSRTPDYQTIYAQGTGGSFDPRNSLSWGPKITDLPNDPVYGGNIGDAHPGKYRVPQLETAGLDPWVTPQVYDNWNDYFHTGVTSNSGVNVSRATNEGSFAIGLGYTDQEGIALNTGMTRYNAKISATQQLSNHFNAGFSGNYSNISIDKLTGANDGSLAGVLAAPLSYNLKGIPSHPIGNEYSQIYYRSLTFDNPYWVEKNNTFNEKTTRFFGNTYIEYHSQIDETKKINVKYQLGVDTYSGNYTDIFGYGSKGGNGSINNYGVTSTTVNSLLTAIYDWKLSEDLGFNLLIGNEINQDNDRSYSETGNDFNFGGWNHIDNTSTQTASTGTSQSRTIGMFYNASLDYKNMLYFNTTGRRDIVSTMPRNNRSFFYPSVSLGFVFTEIDNLKELDWLNFGKLRASYAEVGQAGNYYQNYYDIPSYEGSWWKEPYPITYPLGGVSSYIPYGILYDPNLKPQNTKSYEVGTELKFFDNRLGIDYTFSHQTVVDQIFTVPLAGSTGVSSLVMNGGDMRTDAHEFTLYFVPVKTADFLWDVSVNFSKARSHVEKLAEGVESIFLGGFVTPQVRAGIGYSFPVIYGTAFARDDEGRILVDEDPLSASYGMPYAGEDKVIGEVSPKFIIGASTNLSFKRVSLGATFEWKNGGQMYSGSNGLMDTYGVSKRTEDRESTFVYKGYKADGTPNDIVRGGANDAKAYQTLYSDVLGNIDEAFIYGNSFVKLREISLRYNLPKRVLLGIEDISLSVFSRNILLWTELPNLDPESSQGNTNMMGGFERFSLPQTTSFGFGLDIKF
ncbi:SusC/RagA family TonB-linked outer membrane protein [uncultured Proteiniphilum sp.]|uniref:SusC/RagA family TonB-linked outer membrane protein n=1 Tax=uncultured Proteiniphilum sp. TaxID=497637 RepID=UPI00263728EB|nr:SusC/RagA family TonB-linked outer membrane protein [uncultured Proteiniphilum sp.]